MEKTKGSGVGQSAESDRLEEGTEFVPKFDSNGLIPAVVTNAANGEVLMFAWMNAAALSRTIETGTAHFFSRSRAKIWMKGEKSGNLLRVQEMRTDCDQDVIWLRVQVKGAKAACHTGRRTCFYRAVTKKASGESGLALKHVVEEKAFDPKDVYGQTDDDKKK